MNESAKPLPPYANRIDLNDGTDLVVVRCGSRAWEIAKVADPANPAFAIVFPRGRDPSEFHWPVSGKLVAVTAGDAPDQEVDLLAVELLRAGAVRVRVCYRDGYGITYDNSCTR